MWIYEKRLQYPVKITKTCPKTAQLIISQYGGPDGELSASMRYLAQALHYAGEIRGRPADRYRYRRTGSYGDHMRHGLPADEGSDCGRGEDVGDLTLTISTTRPGSGRRAASALPFSAVEFQSKGDAVTDLTEDLAAEQKARTVYDNLLRMITDPEVREPL